MKQVAGLWLIMMILMKKKFEDNVPKNLLADVF